jgi:tetratricopeptide (TPR) repeat protein
MADCERGLGRPERALEMLRSPEAATLDSPGRVELLIVAAGARADLGELEAAVITLQVPQLRSSEREPWLARLQSAYADALAAVGRDDEAREWLERAAENDEDGSTGAAERVAELDGFHFVDVDDEDDDAAVDDVDDVAANDVAANDDAAKDVTETSDGPGGAAE